METIRSFIAVELPENLKKELIRFEDDLRKKVPDCARWVNPDGIHLTLKFLGNIRPEKVEEIRRAIEESCRNTLPFELKVTEIGVFPSLRRIQVIWIGVSGDLDRLVELQKSIDANLKRLGFTPETRPFTPHLTIARIRESASPEDRKRLSEVLSEVKCELMSPVRVESISLMRSDLTPGGAIYHQICEIPLKRE